MNWNDIVERVSSSVVKVETPDGHGTGFLCFYNESKGLCGIATANHVVDRAEQWQQPIRIRHYLSTETIFLKEGERVIFQDYERDSAVIIMPVGKLEFPEQSIPLLPRDNRLPIGVEIGWLGYPAVAQHTLCFFSGIISAWQEHRHAYLIDGVAINGVSGGPVVYSSDNGGVQIVGTIAAYIVNRATGEALPGLSVAQDVWHFQTGHIKSIDEASKKKLEQQTPAPESTETPKQIIPSTAS